MAGFPRLLVSSVVRGSRQGDSHGGLYLCDLNAGKFEQVLDWNTSDIDWEGRGADRGLRGIVIMGEDIFIAASEELFVFDRAFRRKASYRNPYLKHCHEMSLAGDKLWLTSTGFDSLLRFDLASRAFDFGIQLLLANQKLNARTFDPRGPGGPAPANEFHINSVHADATGIFAAGRRIPGLVQLTQAGVGMVAPLPLGTHNARPFNGGVLYNDTDNDCVKWVGLGGQAKGREVSIPVPRYDEGKLTHIDFDESGLARQAFGRGLCPLSSTMIAAGSSPTTIAIHDLAARKTRALNITMDIRNAAHGLAVWPF
ncbi:MAG TPA: hypothetical protein VG942_07825 [Hyphomonadaceae bacterium]|nr:hypothetical protein [Hyphomonadaceae bacterium]